RVAKFRARLQRHLVEYFRTTDDLIERVVAAVAHHQGSRAQIPARPFNLPGRPPADAGLEASVRAVFSRVSDGDQCVVVTGDNLDNVQTVAIEAAYRLEHDFPDGCAYLENGGTAGGGERVPALASREYELLRLLGVLVGPREMERDIYSDALQNRK